MYNYSVIFSMAVGELIVAREAYSSAQVLLNKHQISGGGAKLNCYQRWNSRDKTCGIRKNFYVALGDVILCFVGYIILYFPCFTFYVLVVLVGCLFMFLWF